MSTTRARSGVFRALHTCLLSVVSCLAVTEAAFAHAGPQVVDIRPQGAQASEILVSNRGLILRNSAAAHWQLMCNEALGVSTVEVPDLAELPDGSLLAGTVRGLRLSHDRGCSWRAIEPFTELTLPSLTQHPSQPNRVYITSYGPDQSALRVSDDGGMHWQTLLKVEDSDYLQYIRISTSDPRQMYVRSLRFGNGAAFVYAVLHSSDAGQTWQRHGVSATESESDVVLLGVSPTDPSLVVAKAEASNPAQPERLLVSHDAGEHFAETMKARVISAATWSRDGDTLWIGADEGLWRSSDGANTFERIGAAEYISCLTERDDQLLACGFYHGVSAGFPGVGVSRDRGATFDRWMQLKDVVEPLACSADAPTTKTCSALWVDWQREILGTIDAAGAGDAGSVDASALRDASSADSAPARDAGAHANPPPPTDADVETDAGWRGNRRLGCGCRIAATGSHTNNAGWLIGAVLATAWWRSSNRRQRLRS